MTRATHTSIVFGFASTHDALAAEEALRAEGVPFSTVPAPRELGTLCGIALQVGPEDASAAERAMSDEGLEWAVRTGLGEG